MESTSKVTQGAADSPASAAHPQIAHYRVTARIGRGGMGEVWQATDTKLGREVAIKLLPGVFAGDPIRLARVKREAQLLASLNHPGIAAIYGIEESAENGAPALVMELVEGPTLADRIAAGAIPIDEALPILRQIAEALEYAHERGVVHRDLKPANIKITPQGQVKVLDFGLAKAMAPDEASGDMSNSPTLSLAMTEAGLLLGTACYMSPEQAKAKPVDRRADIWAFACVAFEMLTRKKAFDGETVSDILAAVIMGEPDWNALPAATPASIQRLLRRCLRKDLRQRLQAIGDARIAIEETLAGDAGASLSGEMAAAQPVGGGKKTRFSLALPWALGAVALALAGITAWLLLKPEPQPSAIRFAVPPPENTAFVYGGELELSPDGRSLAFIAQAGSDKPWALWVRPLDSLTAVPIQGTDGAAAPFWSPDSQEIAFYAGGKLEKVAVAGGAPQTLCDTDDTSGGDWNRDGVIIFTNHDSIYRVPEAGGAPTLVASPDTARHESAYRSPVFLPDGRHFLFQSSTGGPGDRFIAVGSLDSKSVERLAQTSTNAAYAPPGYLIYMDRSTLMARPFNARALRFTGPPVSVAENVAMSGGGYGYFSVSPAGILAYTTGSGMTPSQMLWFNREGKQLGTVGPPDIYTSPAISPDGGRLAAAVGEPGKRDVWVFDLNRGTASRINFNPADDMDPAWPADGTRIFFSSDRDGSWDIYQKSADGLGSVQPVYQAKGQTKALDDLSADGRYAIYTSPTGPASAELWVVPLFGDRKASAFVQGGFNAWSARFSPNGRYVAYSSDETGRGEVYVQTFPQPTGRWQISAAGGEEPMWRRDGKELFYLAPDNKLMAVAVSTDAATFQPGIPKELFQTQVIPSGTRRNVYVASPDGQRFLVLAPTGQARPEPIAVVVNWLTLLKQGGGQ